MPELLEVDWEAMLGVESVSDCPMRGDESSISSLCSNNFLFGGFHPQSDKAFRFELMLP